MKKNEKFNFNQTIEEISVNCIFKDLLKNLRDAQGHRFDKSDLIYIFIDDDFDIEKQNTIYFGAKSHISNLYFQICSFKYMSLFSESSMLEIAKDIVSSLNELNSRAKNVNGQKA